MAAGNQNPTPKWLWPWLSIPFYQDDVKCSIHVNKFPTIYCGVCMSEPVCETCWRRKHAVLHDGHHHLILRVCRASYRPAIPICDIKRLLNISQIQHYAINSKPILHLTPPKLDDKEIVIAETKHASSYNYCDTCKRKLKDDDYTFCSIACKYKNAMVDHAPLIVPPVVDPAPLTAPPKVDQEIKKREITSNRKFRRRHRQTVEEMSRNRRRNRQTHVEKVDDDHQEEEIKKMEIDDDNGDHRRQRPQQQYVAISMRKRPRKQMMPQRAPLSSYSTFCC